MNPDTPTPVADSELKRKISLLSHGERLRLLYWMADRVPHHVKKGMERSRPLRSIPVLAWTINGMGTFPAPAPEGTAGEP